LIILAVVVALLAIVLRPGDDRDIQLISTSGFALLVVVFSIVSGTTGYILGGYVRQGNEIQTPIFRAEKLVPTYLDGTPAGCLHYLGSGVSMSVFFDSDTDAVVRIPTESLLNILDDCEASRSDE